MIKTFLIILVLSCPVLTGQLTVKSEHILNSFLLDGTLEKRTNIEWVDGAMEKYEYQVKAIYLIKGNWECENHYDKEDDKSYKSNCRLNLNWSKSYKSQNESLSNKENNKKSKTTRDPFFDPFFDSFYETNNKKGNNESSIIIFDLDDFIYGFNQVKGYVFSEKDTDIEYNLENASGKIFRQNNGNLELLSNNGEILVIKNPDVFLFNFEEWIRDKPY